MRKFISRIRNFFVNLRRSFRWFVRMWDNHDFDDGYLMQVIVWKMKDMLYQLDVVDRDIVDLRHQPHCTDNGYDGDLIKSLEECIEIGERLLKDDYAIYPEVVNEWFETHGYEKMPDDIRKLFIDACKEGDDKRSEDNEKFFDTMKKHHWGWWS